MVLHAVRLLLYKVFEVHAEIGQIRGSVHQQEIGQLQFVFGASTLGALTPAESQALDLLEEQPDLVPIMIELAERITALENVFVVIDNRNSQPIAESLRCFVCIAVGFDGTVKFIENIKFCLNC